jgi:hypothetical protein
VRRLDRQGDASRSRRLWRPRLVLQSGLVQKQVQHLLVHNVRLAPLVTIYNIGNSFIIDELKMFYFV